MNKYKNRKVEVCGFKFDSKAEAKRFQELMLLLETGEITSLQLQPRFELQPSYKKNNKTIRKIEYIADFAYIDKYGKMFVEDVKGMETKVFRIKKKMFEYRYPELELTLIKRR